MKKTLLTIILIFLLCNAKQIFAQGLCNVGGGGFELDKSEGCAPLRVNIKNTVPNSFNTGYAVQYDGGQNPLVQQDLDFTNYSYPGEYTILQVASISTGRITACKKVTVYDSRTPDFQYTSCGGGKIKLIFINNDIIQKYDRVEINWGDNKNQTWNKGDAFELEHDYADVTSSPAIKIKGIYNANPSCPEGIERVFNVSFQQPLLKNIQISQLEMRGNGNLEIRYEGLSAISTSIMTSSDGGQTYANGGSKTSGGTQFFRVSGLNATQSYKLKLASMDLCGGKLDSEIATSMALKGSTADEKNSLSWNKYGDPTGFKEYQLTRDGVILKTFTDINTISFEDEDVQCGDNYEYILTALTNTVTSISAPLLIKTITLSPKAVEQAYVTVKADDLIELTAVIPGSGSKNNYDILIERSVGGISNFKKVNTLFSETVYEDLDVKANQNSYCYRMTYQNACGQKSVVSQPVCSVLLQNQSPLLGWTSEKPFIDEMDSFTLIQTGSSGSVDEKNQNLANTYYPNLNGKSDPEYTFQIRADSKSGNFQSFSNIITYKRDADIFFPDAFSPNGDGINDIFEVRAAMFKTFNMSVLNRWGEVVFHSTDMTKGWDGTIKGMLAPVGSYICSIEIVDNLDQTVKKNGTFVLLK